MPMPPRTDFRSATPASIAPDIGTERASLALVMGTALATFAALVASRSLLLAPDVVLGDSVTAAIGLLFLVASVGLTALSWSVMGACNRAPARRGGFGPARPPEKCSS